RYCSDGWCRVARESAGTSLLLSLKPRFSEAIFGGQKSVELRRVPPLRDVEAVLIYETAPTSALVGWFSVDSIVRTAPAEVWEMFGSVTGLERTEFDSYFEGCNLATAIRVAR